MAKLVEVAHASDIRYDAWVIVGAVNHTHGYGTVTVFRNHSIAWQVSTRASMVHVERRMVAAKSVLRRQRRRKAR